MRAKDIKKWIDKNQSKYVNLLQLQDWQLRVYIINKDNPVSKENDEIKLTGKGFCAAGDCRAQYEYHIARIRLFAKQIPNVDYLRRVFVHELAHVATSFIDLYTRYFSNKVLPTDECKDVARNLKSDIHELLAVQIEMIVCGKDKNFAKILNDAEKVKDELESLCSDLSIIKKKRISLYKDGKHYESTLAMDIVERQMKDNPNYWYEQWRKAKGHSEEEIKKEKDPPKIITPPEPLSEYDSWELLYDSKKNIDNGKAKIITTDWRKPS